MLEPGLEFNHTLNPLRKALEAQEETQLPKIVEETTKNLKVRGSLLSTAEAIAGFSDLEDYWEVVGYGSVLLSQKSSTYTLVLSRFRPNDRTWPEGNTEEQRGGTEESTTDNMIGEPDSEK